VLIRFRAMRTDEEYVRRIAEGEFDLMALGPLDYVKARRRAGITPVIGASLRGEKFYHGMIVGRPEIRRIDDLRGKRVTYVEEGSASGHTYQVALLLAAGIDPRRDFAAFEPSGSHNNVIHNVLGGRFDAGFCLYDARTRVLPAGEIDRLRVVAMTAPISSSCLGFSQGFIDRHPDLAGRMRAHLLAANDDSEALAALMRVFRQADAFAPSVDSDFDSARSVLETIERARH
jgi:phosphonate transport system substrate-binding protein